jgi:zinc/manganese transport system permease protein
MTGAILLDGFSNPVPSLNPISDISQLLQYQFMRNAFEAGTIVAIVAGLVGYFVVLRGLSFAGHALAHIGYAGATGSVLVGLSPLLGLQAFCIGAAMAMGGLGKRLFGRDVAIGMVMAFSLGLGQLFVSLYRGGGNSNQSYSILFGEVLGISRSDIMITLITSLVIVVLIALLYRPLLFASLDEDVAEARGIRVRGLGVLFLGVLGLTVGQSVQVTGVLLIFALLVAPAAIAQRISARPSRAIFCSIALALLFTWGALAMAYYEPYPVSFFLTAIAFAAYLLARVVDGLRSRGRGHSGASMLEVA